MNSAEINSDLVFNITPSVIDACFIISCRIDTSDPIQVCYLDEAGSELFNGPVDIIGTRSAVKNRFVIPAEAHCCQE